jgi:dUTP pyrophosphatase
MKMAANKNKGKIHEIDNLPVTINVKLAPGAKMPEYAHEGDAGLDLFANEKKVLLPSHRVDIGTGVFLELPKGYVALIKDKSGLAIKNGITIMGGVIDSGYRGECRVILVNLSSRPFRILRGMKIAQALIQRVENVKLEKIQDLSETSRGDGKFGSTGLGEHFKTDLKKIKKAVGN